MPFINIEIKAKCFHPEKVEAFLFANHAEYKGIDKQKDTYFNVPAGRLKLRQGNIENTLIYYHRPNQAGPKQSDFSITQVGDGPTIENLLAAALGVLVVVEKRRKIFYISNVKFHIDEVPGLGSFVEIEAGNMLNESLTEKDLLAQCELYMRAFEIEEKDLIENSYSDMLLNN
ncbi:MAG: class IV adenylate cyclase [Bacteroidota bacterium]|nr:class IV adenylate cyclase [Bacteroidota bacterium]